LVGDARILARLLSIAEEGAGRRMDGGGDAGAIHVVEILLDRPAARRRPRRAPNRSRAARNDGAHRCASAWPALARAPAGPARSRPPPWQRGPSGRSV